MIRLLPMNYCRGKDGEELIRQRMDQIISDGQRIGYISLTPGAPISLIRPVAPAVISQIKKAADERDRKMIGDETATFENRKVGKPPVIPEGFEYE